MVAGRGPHENELWRGGGGWPAPPGPDYGAGGVWCPGARADPCPPPVAAPRPGRRLGGGPGVCRSEPGVRAGFSGAGARDEHAGNLLEIVVSEYTDYAGGLSWLLPVEAILAPLPLVSRWAVGDSVGVPDSDARDGDWTGRVAELVDW